VSDLAMAHVWTPRGAWHNLVNPGRLGRLEGNPGVFVELSQHLGLASVIGGEDRLDDLARAVSTSYQLILPTTPRVARANGLELIWSGRNQWLAASAAPDIARQLATDLKGLAAVSDQSDARAVLRLAGPRVRETLSKGCMVDLHPSAFGAGDVAITAIAHIGVHLWQVDKAPTYELAVFRSMARDFWFWLSNSAAEFGLEVSVRRDSRG
jgi:heterotetrameric sarcosine oxidase gamma subunit